MFLSVAPLHEGWAMKDRSIIRVKSIYNFLLIHASFVMLSHVFIIILHYFYVFCRTNLLTRYLVPVSCFCCFCISENLLLEIFSELDENFRGIFIQWKAPGHQRGAWGATHRPGAAPCRDPRAARGWDPPLPCGHPLGPLRRL